MGPRQRGETEGLGEKLRAPEERNAAVGNVQLPVGLFGINVHLTKRIKVNVINNRINGIFYDKCLII